MEQQRRAGGPSLTKPVRPSDADREAVETRLRTAVGEGRLTLEEFADRMGFALSAETSHDLVRVTADLPDVQPQTPRSRARPRRSSRWLVAVMGAFSTPRRWRPARHTNAVAIMGGGEVDLRSAEIEGDQITITAVAVMGGIEVIVPRGVDVDMTGFALMGGREFNVDESALVEGAPFVLVRAFALMGGVEIRSETEKEARERLTQEGRDPDAVGTAASLPARTTAGPPEQRSWWGRLALAVAAFVFVSSGGPGAVAGVLPDGMVIMGSRQVDAQGIAPGEVRTVEAGALMGSVEILVDPGTLVEFDSIAVMGSQGSDVAPPDRDEQRRVLRVEGGVLMGSIEVTDDPEDLDSPGP